MAGVIMDTDLLRQFGDLHFTQGTMTETAGTIDQAATVAAASTALGPIGSEFLAAFAAAQANHARAVAQLTAVYQATGAAAQTGAADYDLTEADSASSFIAPEDSADSLAAQTISSDASAASAESGELVSVAGELLQVAGQGIGLAASVGGQVATATQQAAASRQANQVAQNQRAAQAGTVGNTAPAAGVQRNSVTAGPAAVSGASPDRAQAAAPGQMASAAPESEGIESA